MGKVEKGKKMDSFLSLILRLEEFLTKKLILCILVLASSCGYINDKPVEKKSLNQAPSQNCEFDLNELKNFTQKNLELQLECMKKNFQTFTKYVKTSHQDDLHKKDLEIFLKRFFRGNSEKLMGGLKLLFEINTLVLYENSDSMSQENMDQLFQLMILSNKQGLIISNLLKDISLSKGKDFWKTRDELKKVLTHFTETTTSIISQNKKFPKVINLPNFIKNIKERFNILNIDDDIIKQVTFAKKVFLGGEREELNSREFFYFLKKAPEFILLSIDFFFLDQDLFTSEKDYVSFFRERSESLEKLVYPFQHFEKIFSYEELIQIISMTFSGEDLEDVKFLIESTKKNILKGPQHSFSMANLKNAFLFLDLLLEFSKGYYKIEPFLKINSFNDDEKRKKLLLFTKETTKELQIILKEKGMYLPSELHLDQFLHEITGRFHLKFKINPDLIRPAQELVSFLLNRPHETPWKTSHIEQSLEKISPIIEIFYEAIKFSNEKESLPLEELIDRKISILRQIEDVFNLKGSSRVDSTTRRIKVQNIETLLGYILEKFDLNSKESFLGVFQSFCKNVLNISSQDYFFPQHLQMAVDYLQFYQMAIRYEEDHKLFLKDITLDNFSEKNETFLKKTEDFASFALSVNKERNYKNYPSIEYLKLLSDIKKSIPELDLNIEMIQAFSKFKPLLLGGDSNVLTHKEIEIFLKIAPLIIELYTKGYIRSQWPLPLKPFEKSKVIIPIIRVAKEIFSFNQNSNYEISENEIIKALSFFGDQKGPESFIPTFGKIKQELFGTKKDSYSNQDIINLLSTAEDIFENIYAQKLAYDQNKDVMNFKGKINFEMNIDLGPEDEKFVSQKNLPYFKKEFNIIMKNYQFFKKDLNSYQLYTNDLKRTEYGIMEFAILRQISGILLKSFGHYNQKPFVFTEELPGPYSPYEEGPNEESLIPNYSPENYQISLKELDLALKAFKPVLKKYNLWSRNIDTFAQNTMLLGDLFQYQSNGDFHLNQSELSEYGALIMNAVSLSNKIIEEMAPTCSNEKITSLPEINCFKKNFFDFLLNKVNQKKFLPKLNQYISHENDKEQQLFLESILTFSRDSLNPEDPMSVRDMTLLIGALLNIESTFIRYDLNEDNIVDEIELGEAFKIYENAIIKLSKSENSSLKKTLAKTSFFYMIKFKEEPSSADAILFHMNYNYNALYPKEIRAERINIAAILAYIVRKGAEKRAEKQAKDQK